VLKEMMSSCVIKIITNASTATDDHRALDDLARALPRFQRRPANANPLALARTVLLPLGLGTAPAPPNPAVTCPWCQSGTLILLALTPAVSPNAVQTVRALSSVRRGLLPTMPR